MNQHRCFKTFESPPPSHLQNHITPAVCPFCHDRAASACSPASETDAWAALHPASTATAMVATAATVAATVAWHRRARRCG